MTTSHTSVEPSLPAEHGFLAPPATARPVGRCYRCGTETPPGVSLCDADNPGGAKAPSATQVHATILVGVVAGVALLLLLFRFAVARSGPYDTAVAGHIALADGGVEVAVTVTNAGDSEGVANCRITRDGSPRADDLAFRTDRLAPGASVTVTRTVPPPPPPVVLVPERMTVICA